MLESTQTVQIDIAPEEQALRMHKFSLTLLGSGEQRVFEQMQVDLGSHPDCHWVFEDPSISRFHARIQIDERGYRIVDLKSKNGTFVQGVRIGEAFLKSGQSIQLGRLLFVFKLLDEEIEIRYSSQHRLGALLGKSLKMREIFAMIKRVGPTPVTVLIEGESGTGKELVAQAIHERSPRKKGPFIVFDCSAVPAQLIESELFGHVKGAFTGASQNRKGAFEQAHGGTLFLDELGELSLDLQPKLLRVMETRTIRPVGSMHSKKIDVRIIAATNRDLFQEVQAGHFREDLYYRFAVIQIHLPPLRQRKEDIPLLAEHFLERYRKEWNLPSLQITYQTMEKLMQYPWHGNVRELKNYIERAALLSKDHRLETQYLSPKGELSSQGSKPEGIEAYAEEAIRQQWPFKRAKQDLIQHFEWLYWQKLLERTDGNVSKAARMGGIHRKSLEYILKKLNLSRGDLE